MSKVWSDFKGGALVKRNWSIIILVLILLSLGLLSSLVSLWMNWLWFQESGYPILFSKSLVTKIVLAIFFGLLFFLVVYSNVRLARRLARGQARSYVDNILEFPHIEGLERTVHRFLLGALLLLAYIIGSWAAGQWDVYLRYQNAVSFGVTDPLFSHDIGFYFFTLPFYNFLYLFGFLLLLFSFLASLLIYGIEGGVWLTRRGLQLARPARWHLSTIVALFLFLLSFYYQLEIYDLLFSERGIVYGASFTDINAQLPVLRLLIIISAFSGILVALSAFLRRYTLALSALGLLLVVALVGNQVYPEIIQRFEVAPNEISKEAPFIDLGIKYTRMAYGIKDVQEEEFPAVEDLSQEALKKNELTLQNIRLWDHRPLLRTYGQLQVIRTYYDFEDVDNDRYLIDGKLRQVSLSPRELSSERLPSRIWINEHLTYTHGYGLCMGPVNQFTKEGLPTFVIKDIPPRSSTHIKVTRPQIYYGEISNSYCFVKTAAKEFDYPAGDQNVYTVYTGRGGIPVHNFFRKLLFSFRFKEPKIFLSSDIRPDSRLMFDRSISTRLQKLLPFIRYDKDPYMVISEEGHLFWIIDGYTLSDRFPYSQPTPDLGNYIRNSVKATIDAYNGTVFFYISDPGDPLIQVYSRIFPGVFKPMDQMPPHLRRHLRYPEDLFTIQANIYATYHMTDSQVFYNKEDLWRIPTLGQAGGDTPLEPYYTIMKLNTKAAREEFILMIPFTPARRENMIAWMAARCDEPNYGKLIVYDFPKQRLVYGPTQIVSRINQEAEISKQLTLWSTGGSTVIRGSLLVIPVEESILYIQPLYLAAAQKESLPELKRVIVAFGNSIAMEETLELALTRIFGGVALPSESQVPPELTQKKESQSINTLVQKANDYYQRAQSAVKQGDWSRYGEEVKRLGEVLKELQEKAK
ncbi:MAG: UPF0182 family protein [Acidobacteria bacterium]|nr:MAG: UPF0182 family protein [Acidobacteriota bacterium]